jgi:hypothetical protein
VQLDLPTLVTMGSFASACAGVVLLLAWWQHREVPALALWGLGNFVDTSGIFCLMVGPVLHRPALIMLADALVALGPGLIWKAARSLDGKPAPWGIAVLGGVVVGLASASPTTRSAINTLCFISSALYLFAAAYSLWAARAEIPGSGIEAAWARADRIRTSFMEACRIVGEFQVDATVSGGVATSAAPRRALDTLLASADVALYTAKTEGRNRIKRSSDTSDTGEPGVIRVA